MQVDERDSKGEWGWRADECLGAFGQSELEERVGGAEQKPKSSTINFINIKCGCHMDG